MQADMFVVGHRGAAGRAPENTVRACQKAVELGVAMIEIDVQLCATGELVVFHDATVDRVTDGTGVIAEMSFSELQRLRVCKTEPIALLESILDAVDRRIRINIELKGPGTAEPVARIIDAYVTQNGWSYCDFIVSSFDHYELKRFKEVCPDVAIGTLLVGIPIGYTEFVQQLGASVASFSGEFITKALVDNAHRRGLQVFAFTVNTQWQAQQLASIGVDGIFSDYPDCFMSHFQ